MAKRPAPTITVGHTERTGSGRVATVTVKGN